jgi:acyl-CoA thioesterase II
MTSDRADGGQSIIALTAIEGRADQHRFTIADRHCAGPRGQPFLFGGTSLAAAIVAMEECVGAPVAWANAQYHSFARPGETVTLTTHLDTAGKRLSQARLTGEVQGRSMITVQATLGITDSFADGQWVQPRTVRPWRDCPVVSDQRIFQRGINTQLEFRLAAGRYPDGSLLDGRRGAGHLALWVRPLPPYRIDRPMLAVIADYMSLAICDGLGDETGSNSLDNTVRFHALGTTGRVLAELYLDGISHGVADARALLFSEGGELLATASTSLAVRSANRNTAP